MTLEQAIQHCKDNAEDFKEVAKKAEENYNKSLNPIDMKSYIASEEDVKYQEQLAEWLTELKEHREADRWIPVSERLPDKSGLYLVSIGDLVTTASFSGKSFFKGLVDDVGAIAWKPLPEPYKENDK